MEQAPLLGPWQTVAFAFVVGLVIGSFLNVVIHRVPRGESIVWPGSHCPACGRTLRAFENVPLLSWVVLRGRCRTCGARIALRYPVVELLAGLAFAAVVAVHGLGFTTPLWLAFVAALIAAAGIDFDHRFIPDTLSLGGLAVGLLLLPAARWLDGAAYGASLGEAGLGALLGGGLLWIVGFGHARLSVALGRRFEHWPGEGEELPRLGSLDYWTWFPGLGFGDVKLLAMVGAFLGPVGVIQALLAAAVAGLLLGLCFAAARRSFAVPFGFAPAIAAGAIAVLLSPVSLLPPV